jgi:hypothetical protein
MDAKINITIGNSTFEKEYVVGLTRASRDYDYYGVIQVETGSQRIVAIPAEDVEMQVARYESGMYNFAPCGSDLLDAEVLIDLVVSRLLR